MAAASTNTAAIDRLAAILPPGRLLARPAELAVYESDGLTAFRARPLAVVVPETADEVVAWGGGSRERLGPDWCGLFTGNEGLFGIAVEVTLQLLPRPECFHTVLAGYRTLEEAGDAVAAGIADPHLCCGSAGTYNIDQPALAAARGEHKARAIVATGADVAATGNIGCLTQLRAHLGRLGADVPVRHTMQLLRDALAG